MKKIFLSLVIIVSFVFGDIGKITSLKGEVMIYRASKELTATIGFILQKNDELRTKDKSKALILFNDGTSITVGKDSVLKINEYIQDNTTPKNNKANFGFGKGVFRTITGQIGKANPDGFKMETKTSSLGIRGSDGTTVVTLSGDVKHTTNSGGFYIINKSTGQSFEIPKGITASFVVGDDVKLAPTNKMDFENSKEVHEEGTAEVIKDDEKKEEVKKEEPKKEEVAKEEPKKEEPKNEQTLNSEGTKQDSVPLTINTEPTETLEAPALNTSDVKINDIPNVILPDIVEENINSNPSFTYIVDTINENSFGVITLNGIDSDGDNLTYEIVSNPSNGTAVLDSNTKKITYTPQANYDGNDFITVKVSDGKGGVDTKIIPLVILNSSVSDVLSVTPQGSLSSLMVDLSLVTKNIMGSDTYNGTSLLEYGYIVQNNMPTSTYLTGITTPSIVIEQYILNNQTASYNGNIASFSNGVSANGTISLDMNFGTKNFTGNINIGNNNWNANIASGTISSYGFNTTNISTGVNSGMQNISGSLNGKFYGPTASSVGGTINLSSGNNTVNGVFGGNKQP